MENDTEGEDEGAAGSSPDSYDQSPNFGKAKVRDVNITYGATHEEPAVLTPIDPARLAEVSAVYVPLVDRPQEWDPVAHPMALVQGPPNSGRRTAALALVAERGGLTHALWCATRRDRNLAEALDHACKRHRKSVLLVRDADELVERTDWDDDLGDLLTAAGCQLILIGTAIGHADRAHVVNTRLPKDDDLRRLFDCHGKAAAPDVSAHSLDAAWKNVAAMLTGDARRTPAAIAALWRHHRDDLVKGRALDAQAVAETLADERTLARWFDHLSPVDQIHVFAVALLPGLDRGRLSETIGALLGQAGLASGPGSAWLPDDATLRRLRLRRGVEVSSLEFEHPAIAGLVHARMPEFGFLLGAWMRTLETLLTPARQHDTVWRRALGAAVGQLGSVRPRELFDHLPALLHEPRLNVAGYVLAEACRRDRALVPDAAAFVTRAVQSNPQALYAALHAFPALMGASGPAFDLAERCAGVIQRSPEGSPSGKRLRVDLRGRLSTLVRADPARAGRELLRRVRDGHLSRFCSILAGALLAQLRAPRALETWGLDFLERLLVAPRGRLAERALAEAVAARRAHGLRRLAWNRNPAIAAALRAQTMRALERADDAQQQRLSPAQRAALQSLACEADWALGGPVQATIPDPSNARQRRLIRLLIALHDSPLQRLTQLWARPTRSVHARAALFRRLRLAGGDTAALRAACQQLRRECDALGGDLWADLHQAAQLAGVPVTYARPARARVSTVLVLYERVESSAAAPTRTPTAGRKPAPERVQARHRRRPSHAPAPVAPARELAEGTLQALRAQGCDAVAQPIAVNRRRPVLCGELGDERRAGFDLVIVIAGTRFVDLDDWRVLLGPALLVVNPDAAPKTLGAGASSERPLTEQVAEAALGRLQVAARAA